MKTGKLVLVTIMAVALLGAVFWYYVQVVESVSSAPPLAPAAAPAVPAAPASAPVLEAEPAIRHPVADIAPAASPAPSAAPAQPAQPLPALTQSDPRLKEELTTLVGRRNVLTFVVLDDFVRRVVVTVDNLGREHASPSMRPVHPVQGRFTVLPGAAQGTAVISPDNGQRYVPLVQFIESVDARSAVALYVQLYPLFQQAYEELGYPRAYFNDRLVAVIDLLLAAPVVEGPVTLELVEVKGPIASEQPWTRYEFADDRLQQLSAGQKMLVRSGAVNHRRLRAKLLELRRLLTRAELPAAAR